MGTPRPRFDDRREPLRFLYPERVLVRCPRCAGRAVAQRPGWTWPVRRGPVRVTCGACGYVREDDETLAPDGRAVAQVRGRCSRCGPRARGTGRS